MPYVEDIMKKNFVEYASYVIKERSIPHINDGCKPVQRRILHTLLEADDGKFHKVANIIGSCTKYHPHGDAPIYESLVALANKVLFIETQGNFGNVLTGDPASAARYIECRISELGKELLYSPEITEYVDSYDGRNKEPVVFPAKMPLVLVTGAEGIAVVMATTILPHNFTEVLLALSACLKKKPYTLYPDFISGGFIDVSEYNDGLGKVRLRAKLDCSDPKRITIRELPFGITTERLITSIEQAARTGKINISDISDYTAQNIEIVINLPRGVYAKDTVDSLYAFTDCETSVNLNPILIHNNRPEQMSNSQIIQHFAKRLPEILGAELQIKENKLLDKIHARTLERIFIEEAIYKKLEKCKTAESIFNMIESSFVAFKKEINREITREDIERLCRIPIRRISAYDIEKHKQELEEIHAELNQIQYDLSHILPYTIQFLKDLHAKYGERFPRNTTIISFETVNERTIAQRNLSFLYDAKTGYMGHGLSSGRKITSVSHFDKIVVFKKSGTWIVLNVEEKRFIGKDVLLIGLVENKNLAEKIFTVIYTTPDKHTYIKRFSIEKFLTNKTYDFLPPNTKLNKFTHTLNGVITLHYKPLPRLKVLKESFKIDAYNPKGVTAKGVRLSMKEVQKIEFH